jgi:DNA mismatch endonuclease (patch repair protein)
MPERFSPQIRRKTMQAVKSRDTELENEVMRQLHRRGIRYRRNVHGLLGTPDIAIKKYKIVVFIDSCFWHGCLIHFRSPETNKEYWKNKIEKNKERDLKVTTYYQNNGWHVRRIWEHELKQDFESTIEEIVAFMKLYRDRKSYNY